MCSTIYQINFHFFVISATWIEMYTNNNNIAFIYYFKSTMMMMMMVYFICSPFSLSLFLYFFRSPSLFFIHAHTHSLLVEQKKKKRIFFCTQFNAFNFSLYNYIFAFSPTNSILFKNFKTFIVRLICIFLLLVYYQ